MTKHQRSIVAICLVSGGAWLWTALASAQDFRSQGPAPSFGLTETIQSGDQPPNGTASGAIQAIAISPLNSATMFVGATNGGIWTTRNGGASWQPLTDNKTSLSISSLAFDPTDTNGQKLIAGVGATSNGRIGSARGGQLTGIMYSNTGGASWTELAGSGGTLADKNIVSVAARGNTFLAAANNAVDNGGGLYYSANGGSSFSLVQGLATGSVSALAGDTSGGNANGNGTRFYAALSGATNANDNGVYLGDPTKPAAWTKVLPLAANQVAKLAAGPGGSVVAAVYDSSTGNATSGKLVGIYLSQNSGASWASMTANLPNTNPGGQAATNLAVAIDPSNPTIIYVAGDAIGAPPHTVPAFRLTVSGNTFSVESLTNEATANGSTVHADARTMLFDASGRLIFGGDGGIYVRTSPASNAGTWTGLNTSTLSVREIYRIAYDGVSKRLVAAAQDTGTAFQARPNSASYNAIGGADGLNAVVNDRSFSESILYFSAQSLSLLTRMTVDAQGVTTSSTVLDKLNFAADDKTEGGENGGRDLPFSSRIVVNRNDPLRLAIATNYVYTTTDGLLGDAFPLTNLGKIVGPDARQTSPTALAYGTQDDPDALLVGSAFTTGPDDAPVGNAWLLLANRTTPLTRLTNYGGNAPTSLVFDDRKAARYYIADGTKLWTNNDASTATTFNDLSANLTPLHLTRPTAVEFIAHNGVNALLVGALSTVGGSGSPLAVADSPTSDQLSNWRRFGNGIPNTLISQLSYNPSVDVLAVATFGRGAWLLYDVTTYFASATRLVYGAADNDSNPDSVWLTGNRPLEKVGSGTLTIAGNATYTGETTVSNGTLLANGSLASSSDLAVGPLGTVRGTGILPATTVFGTIWPGNNALGTLSVNNGLNFNRGSTYAVDVAANGQSGKLAVAGSTTINGGNVAVLAAPGLYAPRTRYTILSSTTGVSGAFSASPSNAPFLLPSLAYDDQNVYLNVQIGGFAAVAQTPTQYAVGQALDASAPSATGDYATVVSSLAQVDASQMPSILTSLSGQNYSGFSNSMVRGAQLFMNNFLSQAGGGNRRSGRIALAEACDVACDTTDPAPWGAWGGALGGLGTVGQGQGLGSGAVTYNVGGFAGGLDRRLADSFRLGVTVGYTAGTQWVAGFSGQGFSNTVQAGLYGGYAQGPVYVDGVAGYAYSANQLSRSILIPGLAARVAMGQTGANQFYGQVEGGYRFDLGGPVEAFVTPFGRLQAYSGTQNAFTESGAQSLNLGIAGQTTNSLRTVVGAQLGGAVDLGWREKLNAQFRLGWSHEFADTSRPVAASFVGAPTAPFTTYGVAPQRDGAVIGLAANTAIAQATSIYLRYEGDISGQDSSHALTAGVRMSW